MALIRCKECGKLISEYANVCPHCKSKCDIVQQIMRIYRQIRKAFGQIAIILFIMCLYIDSVAWKKGEDTIIPWDDFKIMVNQFMK